MVCAWWLIFLTYRTISQLLFGFNIPESVQVLESIVNGPEITGTRDIPNHRVHDLGRLWWWERSSIASSWRGSCGWCQEQWKGSWSIAHLKGSNSLVMSGDRVRLYQGHMIKIWELYPTVKNKTQRKLTRRALIDAKMMSGESEAGAQHKERALVAWQLDSCPSHDSH